MPERDEDRASTGAAAALEVAGVSVHFGGRRRALRRVAPRRGGGGDRPDRPQRRRQDHALQRDHRAATPGPGSVHLAGADVTRMGTHRRARLGLARTFQRLELFSTLSAIDNVRVGLEASGRARCRPRWGSSSASASGTRRRHRCPPCRPDRPASSSWRGPCRPIPRCCSSTSRARGSTSARRRRSVGCSRRSPPKGGRIVLVEHDTSLVLRVCGTVHVLDFGEVIATGTPEEIRARPGRAGGLPRPRARRAGTEA